MNVQNIINEILSEKKEKPFYEEKYPEFFETMPVLSSKVFESNFDKNILQYMLQQKQHMDDSKTTEYDASVKVGTILVDKYVKNKFS